jgi:hypothetical protein
VRDNRNVPPRTISAHATPALSIGYGFRDRN